MEEVTTKLQAAANGDADARWESLQRFRPRLRKIGKWIRRYFADRHEFEATETTSLIHTCFARFCAMDARTFGTKMPTSAHLGKYACATMLNVVRDQFRKKMRELEAARDMGGLTNPDAIAEFEEHEAQAATIRRVLRIAEYHPVAFVATVAKANGATYRQIARELGYSTRAIERKRNAFLAAVEASSKTDE